MYYIIKNNNLPLYFAHNQFNLITIGSPSDEVLLGVHSSFQVVLKQMGKRDTTTKLKVCHLIYSCDYHVIMFVGFKRVC